MNKHSIFETRARPQHRRGHLHELDAERPRHRQVGESVDYQAELPPLLRLRLTERYVNTPRLSLLRLGDGQFEHAVIQIGLDFGAV